MARQPLIEWLRMTADRTAKGSGYIAADDAARLYEAAREIEAMTHDLRETAKALNEIASIASRF